jgi:hypothetical protein
MPETFQPEAVDHYAYHRDKDDPVMLRMAMDILAHPNRPRWLLSSQYTWLLHNEGERYGWFSKWVSAAKREYRHYWRKGEPHPEASYLVIP